MSRRDTLLVAVVINIGLFVLLWMNAFKNKDVLEETVPPAKQKSIEILQPALETPKIPNTPQEIVLSAAPSHVYVVKPGDNPWTIAAQSHIKVEELLKLNHLNEETARRLKPGDQLRIR